MEMHHEVGVYHIWICDEQSTMVGLLTGHIGREYQPGP